MWWSGKRTQLECKHTRCNMYVGFQAFQCLDWQMEQNSIQYSQKAWMWAKPQWSYRIVDQETLVNDPMFSRQAIESFNGKNEKQPERRNRSLKTLATEAVEEKCPICSSNHDIDECEDLKKLPVDERSKVFFKKKFCYGCCKPISNGHNSKSCKKWRKCKHCEGTHLTVLHGFKIKSKERSKQGQGGKKRMLRRKQKCFSELCTFKNESGYQHVHCTSQSEDQRITRCCYLRHGLGMLTWQL